MDIHVFDQQQDLAIAPQQVISLAEEVLRKENTRCDEVSIHFVTTKVISALHSRYFDDPSPTDCISFPIDESDAGGYRVLGEVFVCPKTAIEYASTHESTEPYHETTLYIVHGLLHLIGYDDVGDKEEKMRQAEMIHMKNLEKHHLILHEND